MLQQSFLVTLLAATAAAAPVDNKARQLTGTGTTPDLPGILSELGGILGSPTGSPSIPIPTGLLGGLGGGSGTPSIPEISALPTGLLGGGDSGDIGDLLDGLTGSDSDSDSGSDSSSDAGDLLSGLLGQLGKTKKRQDLSDLLSGSDGLSSLLSDLGGLTGSSTSDTTAASGTAAATADGDCKSVTVIFARGTTEVSTLGTVVGPGLQTDLETDLNGDVTVQGVDYAADAAGIATEAVGAGTGSQVMIADVQAALASCPDTQIVLSGYSQGAMLVHNTMSELSTTEAASVKAAVTFGDPFVGSAIKNLESANWKSFCASGDTVCITGASTSPASGGTDSDSALGHLGYGSDTQTASTFIKSKVTV